MIKRVFGNSHKGAQSASETTLVLGSASVALVQGLTPVALGQDSTKSKRLKLIKELFHLTQALIKFISCNYIIVLGKTFLKPTSSGQDPHSQCTPNSKYAKVGGHQR